MSNESGHWNCKQSNGIGDSLSKLTGTISSNLLAKTIVLINETASRLANELSDMTNDCPLQQAEIIGKKIAIGMAGLRQYKRSKTGDLGFGSRS